LEKRILGKTDLEVTFIGFGALEIGRDWGLELLGDQPRPDEQAAGEMLNFVLDSGVNLIDTARAYHLSEERIGKFIAHRRNEYYLSSKCGEHSAEPGTYYDFSYRAVKESIEKSLWLLRTDYIDIMQIHFGPDAEKVLANGETLAAMKDAQVEGKINFIGASPPHSLIQACIDSGEFDVLQIDYSLLNRKSEDLIAKAAENNIGILVRGGLARGYLTPKIRDFLKQTDNDSLRQVRKILKVLDNNPDYLLPAALQFLQANPNITSVLVGSKSQENFSRCLQALHQPLPTSIQEIIRAIED